MNNDVINELKKEREHLLRLKAVLARNLKIAPEGSLRVNCTSGRKPQFYQFVSGVNDSYSGGTYLTRDKAETVRKLAQKGYDMKMLKWAERTEKRLKGLMDCYDHNEPEIIYNNLSSIKKELIVPFFVSDEEFLKKWLLKWRCDRNKFDKKDDIRTEQGELVRSKSEKIIADKLYSEGIPYVYEPEVVLDDGERLYPDFAALNLRTRKEYLFEHFGKMDETGYCKKNIRKIEDYALGGYILGDGLLATFETNGNMFDTRYLDALIKKYLK